MRIREPNENAHTYAHTTPPLAGGFLACANVVTTERFAMRRGPAARKCCTTKKANGTQEVCDPSTRSCSIKLLYSSKICGLRPMPPGIACAQHKFAEPPIGFQELTSALNLEASNSRLATRIPFAIRRALITR